MYNLTNFNFDNNQVRTLLINDKPYFVGKDVAETLGYSNPNKAIQTHCKGITKRDILTEGGRQEMLVIPEGDVFRLIIKSRLEKAQKFESWVMDEVLPTLRKTGSYSLNNKQSSIADKKLYNDLVEILRDKECFLTFDDLIAISHKKDVREVCRFLTVKSFSERGNIYNLLNTLQNQQELLRLQ